MVLNDTSFSYSEKDTKNINEIKQFLDDNNIDYVFNNLNNFCLHSNDDSKRNYEIEYVSSFHCPIDYPKFNIKGVKKDYFYKKSFEAENNNSFKCWVKDFEWEDDRKREVLKSYFTYAAGKISKKFYARDCVVKEVKTKEARQFESEHCFYGKRGAALNLGLYTKKEKHGIPKDTLIMIYTFGLNFFGKDGSIEVLRVGTKKFHQVIGGASKLLKHFLRNHKEIVISGSPRPVKKVKFYSDYDHNIGSSMDSLGFKFVNYSKGGFMNYWLETGEVKGRQPAKHKLIMEKMKQGKILAIPNAGVKTFVMELEGE